jgi:hypothetical protein
MVRTHEDGGANLDRLLQDGWRVLRKYRATIHGKRGFVMWLWKDERNG